MKQRNQKQNIFEISDFRCEGKPYRLTTSDELFARDWVDTINLVMNSRMDVIHSNDGALNVFNV